MSVGTGTRVGVVAAVGAVAVGLAIAAASTLIRASNTNPSSASSLVLFASPVLAEAELLTV